MSSRLRPSSKSKKTFTSSISSMSRNISFSCSSYSRMYWYSFFMYASNCSHMLDRNRV